MSWVDGLHTQAKKAVADHMSDIGPFLLKQVMNSPQLVKMGINPGGNLSAAEIQKGVQAPIQTSFTPNNNNPVQPSFFEANKMLIFGGIGTVLLLGFFATRK